jgi:general L-amino acid transport system permease protein
MRMTTRTSSRESAFIRVDPRSNTVWLRRELWSAVGLGLSAVFLWWIGHNTAVSLERHGITLGFDFLRNPAGFAIGDAPIAYSPQDSFARAILVGLVNTARVSAAGWVLATALGFVLGLARLSENPPMRALARACVELVRNTPLLLLLFTCASAVHALPGPRQAIAPVPGVFLSDRGLVLPRATPDAMHLALVVLLVAALVLVRRAPRAGWALVALAAAALAASLAVAPPEIDVPRLAGFNFAGGITISPELAALLAALVLHHAAHISEVVRGAVLAVSHRQRDAALALGMTKAQAMRHVIVPQALRAMVPLLATNWVSLTKNSSLAVAIGFPDVVSVLNTTSNQTGHAIEAMAIMVVVYLALSLGVAVLLDAYNARLVRVTT